MNTTPFYPDFLITPFCIKADKRLRPTDGDVYAIIYWFERLKDGICRASNDTIAEILNIDERTVGFALQRLKKYGYIHIHYTDDSMRNRLNIETNVSFSKKEFTDTQEEKRKDKTPGEIANNFFENKESQEFIIKSISKNMNMPESYIEKEVNKFILYWTEQNKSGTKERWQMQQTFDVRRRLATWLNNGKVQQTKRTQGAMI